MRRTTVICLIPAALLCAACGGRIRSDHDAGAEPDAPSDADASPVDAQPDAEDDGHAEPSGCRSDDECVEDESCPMPGGCDGDPCRDDRCIDGTCAFVDLDGCVPDQLLEYTYAACCPTRTLVLEPGGACTFTIEGAGASPCTDVAPGFLSSLIEQARLVGFFDWGTEVCVPSPSGADFALRIMDGTDENTVSCSASSCVGELCNIIDSVWATMPSNWHDGCGCD
jgi:hypothetical protein